MLNHKSPTSVSGHPSRPPPDFISEMATKHPTSVLALAVGLASALGSPAFAGNVILSGDYLRVGVNDNGSLVDTGQTVGIQFNPFGTGAFSSRDILIPGTPYEFYSIGVGGSWDPAGVTPNSGLGSPFGGTTTNTSTGSLFSATTTGVSFGALALSQVLSFASGSSVIDFSVTLTNTGDSALTDVVYGRGLDADQDVNAGGGHPTLNTIVSNDLVHATAPVTGWTIGIYSSSAIPHLASVRGDWSPDPYQLLTANDDGYGDNTINMGWNIGTIAAGESVLIEFQYQIAKTLPGTAPEPNPTPVPEGGSVPGLLAVAMLGLVAVRRYSRKHD